MVEAVAAMTFLVPMIAVMLYAIWQASSYMFIISTLSEAARQAARNCAIAYGAPPSGSVGTANSGGSNVAQPQPDAVFTNPATIVITGSAATANEQPVTPNEVFSSIRIAGVIDDNSQFTAYYTAPAPNNQDPGYATGTVKVVVKYKGTFPSPDVLGLAPLTKKYAIEQAYTYPLEY